MDSVTVAAYEVSGIFVSKKFSLVTFYLLKIIETGQVVCDLALKCSNRDIHWSDPNLGLDENHFKFTTWLPLLWCFTLQP